MSNWPEKWYLLWCLECGPVEEGREQPFSSAKERGKWAAAHTKGTQHNRWHVIEVPSHKMSEV